VDDALSRRVHEIHDTTINMYKLDLCDIILEFSKSDKHYENIKENLQQGISQRYFEGYELKEDGILMYRHRVYVPNDHELKSLIFS
jgi:hypothetical protein